MEILQESLKSLPHTPGVYLYHNDKDEIIYVGKAIDLSRRVKQYFQRDDAVGEKTRRLVSEIVRIETIPVTSEFDALLLEAKLIRKYMPKYNVISRDDKSPLYVALTLHEELPRVLLVRRGELSPIIVHKKNCVYGPFQSAHAVRVLLRQLRSAVPYCTQKQRTGKPCFYTHLGLCSPCPSYIAKLEGNEKAALTQQYRNNIYKLKSIFDGKAKDVRMQYEADMGRFAKDLRFEEAEQAKKRIDALYSISEYRYDPAIFLEKGAEDVYDNELEELIASLRTYYPGITKLERIECFDMSQLYGTNPVGSMVVLTNGKSDTSQYRRFKIKGTGTVSDVMMMREVLTRRLRHNEWPLPDFLLVDGGKPQLQIARNVLEQAHITVPFGGLAKRQEEIIIPKDSGYVTLRLPLSGKAIKVLQRVRDEAHRFAITYHRLLRDKQGLSV